MNLHLSSAVERASGPTARQAPPAAGALLSQRDTSYADGPSARPAGGICDRLTARERDVLAMISNGRTNKHIARAFEISPETVKSHVKRIFLKLAVCTRAEAVSRAGSLGQL
jgi:DNA-binding NarL/FixJ family response regulator